MLNFKSHIPAIDPPRSLSLVSNKTHNALDKKTIERIIAKKKFDSVVKICYNFFNRSLLQNNRALTNVLTQTLTGVITLT